MVNLFIFLIFLLVISVVSTVYLLHGSTDRVGRKMSCKKIKMSVVSGLLGAAVLTSGCTTGASPQLTELENSGFMSLWSTYADCRSTSDVAQATSNLQQLRSASQLAVTAEGFILPLPTHLERLVANPTSRVAVDVEAMTAACALHSGELALNAGQTDIARDLLVSVITLHKEEGSYYVLKAKTLLAKIEQGVNVSFNLR
jgi:hypothetical protein